MKILISLLLFDIILGAAMALYLTYIWHKKKTTVKERGWTPDRADPICNHMWLLCFIPVIGIIYYLVASEIVEKLSSTNKEDADGFIDVHLGNFSFHYDESQYDESQYDE